MVVEIDDRVLVEAAQAGDLDAFATLARRYQAPVYRIALRLLHSSADADDATQDAFVRGWRSLARLRGDSAVQNWLYRIVTGGRQGQRELAATRRGKRWLVGHCSHGEDLRPVSGVYRVAIHAIRHGKINI